MRILNDEEIDNLISDFYDPADFGILYPNREPFEEVAKAQYKRDMEDFIKLLKEHEWLLATQDYALFRMTHEEYMRLKQLVE